MGGVNPAAAGRFSVLVVENDVEDAFVLAEALAGSGFRTARVVASVREALDELMLWTPDLIILDLGIPDAEGFDVLQVLGRGGSLGVPVVVVTGETPAERRVQALELGAQDVVVKPFDVLELGARAVHVVRAHETLEAADVVARALAVELSELSKELDEQAYAVHDTLVAVLELRSPELASHARRVGALVEHLADAAGLDRDVARQLGMAASCHQIGAVALDDATLAQLATGDHGADQACIEATTAVLRGHHRLAVAAARFREPAANFAHPVDRLVAQLTAVCHTFEEGARVNGQVEVDLGLRALQRGLDRGLDVDLVRCFVQAGLPDGVAK
jgi:DNA-binding response OmpR family regulator